MAAKVFAKGKGKIKSLRTAHVTVTVKASGVDQDWKFDIDLKSGAFRGSIDVKSNAVPVMSLRIVRAKGFTWLMAPEKFWTSSGYTADGAAKARGKYVVFNVTEGNGLAERYSVQRIIQAAAKIEEQDVAMVPAESDSAKITLVANSGTANEVRLTFNRSDSRLVELRSDVGGVKTNLRLSKHNEPLEVKFPAPKDVLQP